MKKIIAAAGTPVGVRANFFPSSRRCDIPMSRGPPLGDRDSRSSKRRLWLPARDPHGATLESGGLGRASNSRSSWTSGLAPMGSTAPSSRNRHERREGGWWAPSSSRSRLGDHHLRRDRRDSPGDLQVRGSDRTGARRSEWSWNRLPTGLERREVTDSGWIERQERNGSFWRRGCARKQEARRMDAPSATPHVLG